MIRLWIGTALLAGSWLLGLDYFYAANPWAWLLVVAAAVVLLGRVAERPLAVSQASIAMALFLPAVWFAPWPYRAAPLLVVLGLGLQLLPIRKRWSGWLGQGAVISGIILLVQALALELYAGHTMRSHELPSPLPDVLAGIATLFGADATVDGSAIVMHSMRQVHRLGATWELLLDPATFLFFVGGLAMLACRCGAGVPPAEASIPADRAGDACITTAMANLDWRLQNVDPGDSRVAAAAGRIADGRVSAPGFAIRPPTVPCTR